MKPPLELRHDKRVRSAAQLLARELWWSIREDDTEPVCWIQVEIFDEYGQRVGGLLHEAGLSRSSGYRALNQLRELGYIVPTTRTTASGRKARVFRLCCQTNGSDSSNKIGAERREPAHNTAPEDEPSGPSGSPGCAKSSQIEIPPAGKQVPPEGKPVPSAGKKVPEMGPRNPNSLARSNQENQRNQKKGLNRGDARVGASCGEPAGLPPSSSVWIRRRSEISSKREISERETTQLQAVFQAVIDARVAAGWSVPPEGYEIASDGAFAVELLRDKGVTVELLCAAPWALARDAKTSRKPDVRTGRYVRPSSLFRRRNWEGWIRRRAQDWLDEQRSPEAPLEAANADGSISLGLEISV